MHRLTFEKKMYFLHRCFSLQIKNLVPKYIENLLQFAKYEHYKLRSTNKGDLKVWPS